MNKLLNRLTNEDWTVLVSLPRNDVELARAALRGGARGLKVHLNVHHHASGTHFGAWDDEKSTLERIVREAGEVPVGIVPGGIVPGGAPFATVDEFARMAEIGLDFFDAYPADAPAWTMAQRHLDIMLAAYASGTTAEIVALQHLGMTMCEASIVRAEDYGAALTTLDLARYRELAAALDAPIIVPSQKKITPADVLPLRATGVKGLLIGAIVTGRDAAGIEAATRTFVETRM